jgi:hypothetical protein
MLDMSDEPGGPEALLCPPVDEAVFDDPEEWFNA